MKTLGLSIVVVGLVASGAVVLGGCSSTKAPRFDAVGVSGSERSAEGLVLRFSVEGANENRDPLPLRTITYALSLEGREVFRGQRSPEVTLPGFGTRVFELPAVVPLAGSLPPGEIRYQITGVVEYLEPGRLNEVLFDQRARVPEAPLSITGTFDPSGT
jgi:hypothetical protein